MPEPVTYNHTETYDEVLQGLIDKISKVCRAFNMPFIIAVQTQAGPVMDESRGQAYVPPHTMSTIGIASILIQSESEEDMKGRIMHAATRIAMDAMREEGLDHLRDAFKTLRDDDKEENDNKTLN